MKKILLAIILVLLTTYLFPQFTYANDCSSDPADESCHCIDAFGRHNPDDIWTGSCASDGPTKIKYSCDHNLQINRVRELETTDPMCGYVPTVTPPAGSVNIKTVFGEINPPPELNPFIQRGGSGAGGISLFLNNLIILIYIVAGVVFVFTLLWGALQWLTSGGDKEAVAGARNRIIHAFIGIILFAVAFAIIKVVGTFTGFNFTARQNASCPQRETYYRESSGQCKHIFYPDTNCTPVVEDAASSQCNS